MIELHKVFNDKMIGDGQKVVEFESKVGNYLTNNFSAIQANAVAVDSCTSALHLAYILSGVKEGDEVIVPVLTCTATNHPLLWLKATPVFADIQPDTLNIDPDDVEKKITSKTKAIVCMHNGGQPCDMNRLVDIASRHGFKLIEDCAQGYGGEYKGRKLGLFGDFACLSFQAIKTLTCGDGGMLICKDARDYKRAKKLRWFGIDREVQRERGSLIPSKFSVFDQRAMTFDIDETGYKYSMNNITATIGLANMEEVYDYVKNRKRLLKVYRDNLKGIPGITLLKEDEGHAAWLMTILVEDRVYLQEMLGKEGIETNMVQVRNDIYQVFGGTRKDLPNMNNLEGKYLSLPLNNEISDRQVKLICRTIKHLMLELERSKSPEPSISTSSTSPDSTTSAT